MDKNTIVNILGILCLICLVGNLVFGFLSIWVTIPDATWETIWKLLATSWVFLATSAGAMIVMKYLT